MDGPVAVCESNVQTSHCHHFLYMPGRRKCNLDTPVMSFDHQAGLMLAV